MGGASVQIKGLYSNHNSLQRDLLFLKYAAENTTYKVLLLKTKISMSFIN